MNETIRQLISHSSVRSFTKEPVSEEMVNDIFEAAMSASSTCFLQVVSVIRITDPEKKRQLAHFAGDQKHVEEAPEMWVFVADMHRNQLIYPQSDTGWAEQLVFATHDAGIAAQNAMVALESMGLGGCYIGGLRNHIAEVSELLKLPENTYCVFGLAFGHPAIRNEKKPRLPASITFMENEYKEPNMESLHRYDDRMKRYYSNRSKNAKETNWSETLPRILAKERRPFVLSYLQKQGFAKK